MLGRRRTLVGVAVGLLLVLPVVYFGIVADPTPHGTTPVFLENRNDLTEELEEPFRVEVATGEGRPTREYYNPQTGEHLLSMPDDEFTRTNYDSSEISCSRKRFEDETHFREFVSRLDSDQRESAHIRNETRAVVWFDRNASRPDELHLRPDFLDAWIWTSAGTTTYRGRTVDRFVPSDGWGIYFGVSYLADVRGEALYDPSTGVLHRATASARVERANSHLEALLLDDGRRVNHTYQLSTNVSAEAVDRPEWCRET